MLRAHFAPDAIYVIDTQTNEIVEILDPSIKENRERATAINTALIESRW